MIAAGRPPRGVLVGLGAMGALHLRVLRAMPEAELVAVVDPDPARRAAATPDGSGLTAHPTLGEALTAHELDFAGLATPVALLPELAHEALSGGLGVLMEKPMAPDEEAAAEVIADARARGQVLSVGHVERCNPAVVALKARLDGGLIGRVHQMHARRLSPFPNRHGAQGVALDLATHDVDVMRYLTGSEVARVSAETAAPLETGAEDLLCATLRLDDGATGLIEANWMTPAKVRELTVLGERGMVVVDYLRQELSFYEHPTTISEWEPLAVMRGGGEGDMVRYALERREPLRVEWEGFLAAVRDGTRAPVSGEDGLAALSVARAMREAARRGEVVVPGYRRSEAHAGA